MKNSPFKTFWMAGYECADHRNKYRERVDLLVETGHLDRLTEDYRDLEQFNIKTVREGIRWSVVEKSPFQYDWSTVATMIDTAKAAGVQQIWDVCHFGYPEDLNPLHPQFAERFERICSAFAQFYTSQTTSRLIVTPINEVSFLSWLGGEECGTEPYCTGKGWDLKYRLIAAYIRGIKAIKKIDPAAIVLTTEPLVNIVPPLMATTQQVEQAKQLHELQFQAVDMLCGRMCPELGGSEDLVDILGFNFYYNNQWVGEYTGFLPWLNEEPDERWVPLSSLLKDAYLRYKKPVALTETSHSGEDRHKWIKFIGNQCAAVIKENIPLWGVCLYPIIDRPDWNDLSYWHHSGLWDVTRSSKSKSTSRVLCRSYAKAFLKAQKVITAAHDMQKVYPVSTAQAV